MIADEAQNVVVHMTYRGGELAGKGGLALIKAAAKGMQHYLETGEQSIKKLNKKGLQLESISVSELDLRSIKKELKEFGVDFSVMKNIADKDTYDVFFKARDVTQINKALENILVKNMEKEPMADRVKNVKKQVREKTYENPQAKRAPER
jgi:hypothetical protein